MDKSLYFSCSISSFLATMSMAKQLLAVLLETLMAA